MCIQPVVAPTQVWVSVLVEGTFSRILTVIALVVADSIFTAVS